MTSSSLVGRLDRCRIHATRRGRAGPHGARERRHVSCARQLARSTAEATERLHLSPRSGARRTVTAHADSCCCVWCERVRANKVTVQEWRALHEPHLGLETFVEEPFDHVSSAWYWLRCRCGARFLVGTFDAKSTVRSGTRR